LAESNPEAAVREDSDHLFNSILGLHWAINRAVEKENVGHVGAINYWPAERADRDESVRQALEDKLSGAAHPDYFMEYVVNSDGSVVGYILFHVEQKDPDHLGEVYVHLLAVHPDYQNKGIGENLMKMAFEYAIKNGIDKVYLKVYKVNILGQKFYPTLIKRESLKGLLSKVELSEVPGKSHLNSYVYTLNLSEGATPSVRRAMDALDKLLVGQFVLAWQSWRGSPIMTLGHHWRDVPRIMIWAEKELRQSLALLAQEAEHAGERTLATRLRNADLQVRAAPSPKRGDVSDLKTSDLKSAGPIAIRSTINPYQSIAVLRAGIQEEAIHLRRAWKFQKSLEKWRGLFGQKIGTGVAVAIEEIAVRLELVRLRHAERVLLRRSLKTAAQGRAMKAAA
jgi:ribosomal protein S18 acetylase RimI-like enzyme